LIVFDIKYKIIYFIKWSTKNIVLALLIYSISKMHNLELHATPVFVLTYIKINNHSFGKQWCFLIDCSNSYQRKSIFKIIATIYIV